MTSPTPDVVPTRLLDLSGLRLRDLGGYDPDDMATACDAVISQVQESGVNLAGSQS